MAQTVAQLESQVTALIGALSWLEEELDRVRDDFTTLTKVIESHEDCSPDFEPCYAVSELLEVMSDIRNRKV